jgi:hypothetical protein
MLNGLWGGEPSVRTVRDSLVAQFLRIEDYSVRVKISVNMTGLRMPRKKIKLYFKSPDKIKVEADGFAIVPRTGLGGSPLHFLKMLSDLRVEGLDTLHSQPHWRLSGGVIPDSLQLPIESDREIPEIRMTLWVDTTHWIISRVETEMDSTKIFSMESQYKQFDGFYLPAKTEVKLGFKGLGKWAMRDPMSGPLVDEQDFNQVATEAGTKPKQREFAGTITMEFSKYKINRGLKDKLFEDSDY